MAYHGYSPKVVPTPWRRTVEHWNQMVEERRARVTGGAELSVNDFCRRWNIGKTVYATVGYRLERQGNDPQPLSCNELWLRSGGPPPWGTYADLWNEDGTPRNFQPELGPVYEPRPLANEPPEDSTEERFYSIDCSTDTFEDLEANQISPDPPVIQPTEIPTEISIRQSETPVKVRVQVSFPGEASPASPSALRARVEFSTEFTPGKRT